MNFGSPASTEKKGYATVSKDEDVGSGQDLNPEDVEYWTVSEVGDYLRKRLLEFEGADAETVNELVSTFEAREVDGQTLLGLDDLQLRYELDIGEKAGPPPRYVMPEQTNLASPGKDPSSSRYELSPSSTDVLEHRFSPCC